MIKHLTHGSFREGTDDRGHKIVREVAKHALLARRLRHGLDFREGCCTGSPGFFGQSGPNLNLEERPVLDRVGYSPIYVPIPDMLQPMTKAFPGWEAGQHGIRQLGFQLAVQGIQEIVFGAEVGK